MNTPELSVVILCYRTGNSAKEFVKETISILKQHNIDYELVLVGNYHLNSNDRTPEIVKTIAQEYPRVTAVAQPKEGMMGWDVRTGLEAARGKYIAFIDGDGQMPYKDVLRIYDLIKNNDYDLCTTYRSKRYDGLIRKIISKIYNLTFSLVFASFRVKDINSKPKIMTRNAYERMKLTSDDWFIDAEIIIKAKRFGFRIGQIPTIFEKNTKRGSFITISAILEFIKNIILYRIKESQHKET